ncbi:MAG: FtsX-like permease family protein [Methanomicrobiales archaeon]|nr:FtsX-like permease family protein [Methanomicrobiales archaeon]
MTLQDLKVSWFLAVRGLSRSSRGSTMLTVLIIAMVFTNMIFMPSIVMGFIKNAEHQIITYSTGNILVEPVKDEEYITDVDSLLAKVNRVPGVIRASAQYSMGATLKNKAYKIGRPVIAIQPSNERLVTDVSKNMKEGDYLGDGELGQVIIGIQTAGHKDPTEDMGPTLGAVGVGDSVTVEYTNGVVRNYRIKGIIETFSYSADQDVYVTQEEMESVLGHPLDVATHVLVKTEPGVPEAVVKTQILRFGVREQVKTWQDLLEDAMGRAVQNFSMLNSITLIVSLVIAIVVLFIMIMIKTLNSRRQIGVLKAIGIEQGIIINNYLLQVLLLTILGIVLGVVVVEGMVAYLTVFPFKFPDGDITPYVTFSDLASNTVLILVAAMIAGYIPAWQVARMDILTAMRA